MTQMIDLEREDLHYMDRDAFVAVAYRILDMRNTDNFSNDWVEIRRNYNGLDLQITRQKQMIDPENPKNEHLGVSNPTTMVADGNVIRHHGEHVYLTQHMISLLGDLSAYQTVAYSIIGGMTVPLDHDAKLARAIADRAEINFAERGNGWSTIIAHLKTNDDGSYSFEGLTGTIGSVHTTVERVIADWKVWTVGQAAQNEIDKAKR